MRAARIAALLLLVSGTARAQFDFPVRSSSITITTSSPLGGGGAASSSYTLTCATCVVTGGSTMTGALTLANIANGIASGNYPIQLQSGMVDGASAVALAVDTSTAWTAGKLLSLRSNGVERFSASFDGTYSSLNSAGNFFKVFNSSSSGITAYNSTLYLDAAGVGYAQLDSTGFYTSTPGFSLGLSGDPWGKAWVRAYYTVAQTPAFSATMNIDPSLGEQVTVALTANLGAWTVSAPVGPGAKFCATFVQDATGSRTIGTPPVSLVWLPGAYLGARPGLAPALTPTANKKDTFCFVSPDSANWVEVDARWTNH